jgi:UDP-glucose 4-epimerase
MGERCLVIGGGLLGSRVADALAASGRPTTILSRSFNPWLAQRPAGAPAIELVEGELPGAPEAGPLVAEAEVVFFLAGSSTPQLADEDAAASISALLEPALATFDLMRRAGRRRLVLASSGGTIYGRPRVLPTPESAPTEPTSVHGVNALATEQYALLYARQHGLEPAIMRFSNVYGPGQYARRGLGVIAAWCEALAREEPIALMGDGTVRRDFVFADDAAAAALAACFETRGPGIYNAGSGTSISLLELIELLGEVTGRTPEIAHLPPRAVDVLVTELDCTALRVKAGWRATVTLAEGIERCWRWTLDQLPS